jgi:hypothetical protein
MVGFTAPSFGGVNSARFQWHCPAMKLENTRRIFPPLRGAENFTPVQGAEEKIKNN